MGAITFQMAFNMPDMVSTLLRSVGGAGVLARWRRRKRGNAATQWPHL